MNIPSFAFSNLLRRPARTMLTIFATALGIAALVALTAISWGFEASWQNANDARGTDLVVTRTTSENAMPSPFQEQGIAEELRRLPHVKEASGMLSEMLSVSAGAPPMFVFGWAYRSYLWDHLSLIEGRFPDGPEERSVVLGNLAAEMLHRKVGDRLEIEGIGFVVCGIFRSPAMVENGAILMALERAQEATDKPGKVNFINIKLDPSSGEAELDATRNRVKTSFPGYVAITSGELVSQNAIVRISKAMSDATILIASLVGALIVFNTMLMSIHERTREFGILLALGWQKKLLMQLVFFEASCMTFASGILGIAAGAGLAAILGHLPVMEGKIQAVFSLPFLAMVLILSVLIGILGGFHPALKAARLRPAQALRQE